MALPQRPPTTDPTAIAVRAPARGDDLAEAVAWATARDEAAAARRALRLATEQALALAS